MVKSKMTSKDRLAQKKETKKVVLDHDFAGIKKGQTMFVATPQIVDAYIRKIPYGQTRTILAMRNNLARRYKCDATCPVSTSFFIRMSAEAAIEDLEAGVKSEDVAPFWRLLDSKEKIAKRLPLPDLTWLDDKRAMEQA